MADYYRLDVVLKDRDLSAVVAFRSTTIEHVEFVLESFIAKRVVSYTIKRVSERDERVYDRRANPKATA